MQSVSEVQASRFESGTSHFCSAVIFNWSFLMWVVVNIGCIECGVSSNIVGVFDSKERAEEIAVEFSDKFSWREGGQNDFEVFPMPEANVIADEYLTRADD